jgi:hypothetical protein
VGARCQPGQAASNLFLVRVQVLARAANRLRIIRKAPAVVAKQGPLKGAARWGCLQAPHHMAEGFRAAGEGDSVQKPVKPGQQFGARVYARLAQRVFQFAQFGVGGGGGSCRRSQAAQVGNVGGNAAVAARWRSVGYGGEGLEARRRLRLVLFGHSARFNAAKGGSGSGGTTGLQTVHLKP